MCCPVTPGHGSGIGYSGTEPPGATPSNSELPPSCWAPLGHLKQLLASLAVTSSSSNTIDMSNATNSTTSFRLSVMQMIDILNEDS